MVKYDRGFTRIGASEPWVQQLILFFTGSSPGSFTITPKTGSLQISYVDSTGARRYWNGTAFVAGPPITLSTTIDTVNKTSTHAGIPTVPEEVLNKVLRFQGWINGDLSTLHTIDLDVLAVSTTTPGDILFEGTQPV